MKKIILAATCAAFVGSLPMAVFAQTDTPKMNDSSKSGSQVAKPVDGDKKGMKPDGMSKDNMTNGSMSKDGMKKDGMKKDGMSK